MKDNHWPVIGRRSWERLVNRGRDAAVTELSAPLDTVESVVGTTSGRVHFG